MSVSSDGHGPVQLPVCYAGDADQGVPTEPVATFPAVRDESLNCMFAPQPTQLAAERGGYRFTLSGSGPDPVALPERAPEAASRCASFDF
jgi:hypothetical protein